MKGNDRDIAIIGMSCIFPKAPDLATYWANILGKVDAIGEPTEAWDVDRYFDPDDDSGEKIYTKAGGFLGDLYAFDAPSFGIMPNSVDGGEPDQFMALRVARDALADAGYLDADYDHTNTGVILGHSTYLHRGVACIVQHGVVLDQTVELIGELFPDAADADLKEVRALLKRKLPPFNADVAPGLVPNVMTGRICNRLNLKGPNYIIDAACSSSLLSVQAAAEELRSGKSDLMLAGGVNAAMPAEALMVFTHLGALSRTSRIRPFDEGADGTLLGEGLGVVVLKRLADAQADNDRIYAVVKEIGQSSDGRGMGLLAPSMEGELLAIRRAYAQSGIDPASIGLVEAHGTGIPLGDKTEIQALSTVFGERRGDVPHCALGSVKSMISHCIPAAGIAGLIKTTMALHHGVLPPTLCEAVNPDLGIDSTPMYVNTETRPWVQAPGTPRRAAVNAFGFGGVNTHAILEEPPQAASPRRALAHWPHELALFAAETRAELIAACEQLVDWLERADPTTVSLCDVTHALARAQGGGEQRLAIVCRSLDELKTRLRKVCAQLGDDNRHALQTRGGVFFTDTPVKGKLALLFPGEGAQYPNMMADLAVLSPTVRRWFDFWESLYGDDADFSPASVLFAPPTCLSEVARARLHERLHGVEVGSESVFMASQAMYALLRELGVSADAMVGHSSGENSALVASGLIDLSDPERLRTHIDVLKEMYRALDSGGKVATGAMLSVGAVDRRKVIEVVEASDGAVHLALDNCDHQTVLFGPRAALDTVAETLRGQGGLCAFLEIDRAYHTPLFDVVSEGLAAAYADVDFSSSPVTVYSCATAAPFPDDGDAMRELAVRQWAARVRFKETVDRMYDDGVRLFLEVGPASNLSNFASDILRGRDCVIASTDNRRRDTLQQLLQSLGRLFVHGQALELERLWEGRGSATLDLADAPPKPSRRARMLDNTLPYIRLSKDERATLSGQLGALALPANGNADAEATPAVAASAPGPVASAAAPDPGPTPATPWPFVQHIQERDATRVSATCRLDPIAHGFLRDHVLYTPHVSDLDPTLHGLTVVPLAVSLEMLAEAAAVNCTQPYLSSIENVRAHNWITLDDGPRTLTLSSQRIAADENGERFVARVSDGDATLIEGEIVFAPAPLGEHAAVAELGPAFAPLTPDDALYSTGMFHGPLFQSMGRLLGWNDTGIDAVLNDTPLNGFFEGDDAPEFLLNPVLLDAVGQLTAYWPPPRSCCS
ncbi:MAG: beta-ketoacyl synthase N-terminal-like domain-containing protein, partial [Pseudomonadota bacterium]